MECHDGDKREELAFYGIVILMCSLVRRNGVQPQQQALHAPF